jgi:hypothetical protein
MYLFNYDLQYSFNVPIAQCVLLCELGTLEHGVTKPRNKRRRKEGCLLLAIKLNLLQTSLETSLSCDDQVNGQKRLGDSDFMDPFDRNSDLPANMKNYCNSLQQTVCILT